MFHPIDPRQFSDYENNLKLLEKRVFLYSDRRPLQQEISWAGRTYVLGATKQFDAPGKVSQPSKAILRLTLAYEGKEILEQEADGFLFVYAKSMSVGPSKGDMAGAGVATSQIQFTVYPLNKK